MTAKRIDLHFQRGWHLTISKSGQIRYYYHNQRKSFEAYTHSRERAQRKREKELKGWPSRRAFKREMSTEQSQRWIRLSEVETDEEGYPDIDSDFSRGYLAAYEEHWDIRPHGAFAHFLEDDVGIREDEADYAVGFGDYAKDKFK